LRSTHCHLSEDSEPVVSVIVPVYNGGNDFRKCLESINGAEPAPAEVIVVADGESDGSWRTAGDMGIRVINLPSTAGPARARNRGAAAARGNILLFVDADVTVSEDLFGRVAAAFRDAPRMAAVFGSYDDRPSDPRFLSRYKNLFHHFVHQNANSDASTFWAGCGAIRREVFLNFCGFDESYRHPSIEDIELGCRLKAAGYSLRLDKRMQVKHLKRWQPLAFIKTEFFYRALPWVRLILQRRCVSTNLNVTVRDAVSVCSIYLLLFFGWGAVFICGGTGPGAREAIRIFSKKARLDICRQSTFHALALSFLLRGRRYHGACPARSDRWSWQIVSLTGTAPE